MKEVETTNAAQIISTADAERIARYEKAAASDNTKRAYRTAWAEFANYCAEKGLTALPATPETVAAYVTALAEKGAKASTIQVKASAISEAHKLAGVANPVKTEKVSNALQGIRRTHGTKPTKKAYISLEQLREMTAYTPKTNTELRNRAAILLGFFGAFRRSEIANLNIEDLTFAKDGTLTVNVAKSKTDQEGKGDTKTITANADKSFDPVTALRDWLAAMKREGFTTGALFRKTANDGQRNKIGEDRLTDQVMRLIVRAHAERIGLTASDFGAHSLRSGFITEGYKLGVSEEDLAAQSGHKSRVIRDYNQAKHNNQRRAVNKMFAALNDDTKKIEGE